MKSRFFVFPDRQIPLLSICLLSINDTDFLFRVSKSPPYFEAESKLLQLLRGKSDYVKAELDRSQSLESFCQRMLHFISKLIPTFTEATTSHSFFFRRVLDEIRLIGWDHISSVDPTLLFFAVTLPDQSGRRIEIQFSLTPGFPRVTPKVTSNLPIAISFEWDPQQSHLNDIVEQHRQSIPNFASFWQQLEELDRETFVIEPREPSLDCCFRRIVITRQVEIQIEVNPLRPSIIPKATFIGATIPSREMREYFESRIRDWQSDRTIKENLENILSRELPERETDDQAMSRFECDICYVERLGGEIPDVICENPHCAKRFHRSCLVDWLRVGTSEQSFQVVFGSCPFCEAQIQCTIG
jgi:E3 ubiquitin-protein ligase FANCL